MKGPFYFESNVYSGSGVKIVTFGDHDLEIGWNLIGDLESQKFDLLILLGDYSYDMQRKNGKMGDDYFM